MKRIDCSYELSELLSGRGGSTDTVVNVATVEFRFGTFVLAKKLVFNKIYKKIGIAGSHFGANGYDTRLLFYNSLVLPIFDYADLVWGDKDNVTLMKDLQILQNNPAKLILDRSVHSSSTDALTVLRWLNLDERRKCHRYIYAYKCINGEINHSLDIVRKSDMHSYNTRNNDTIKLPKIKYNWGKHRSRYHCFKDFDELERTVRNSVSLPIFKKCLFSAFYN